VLPIDSRRTRRADRARRRLTHESLETRALMAFSPLGFSPPDLTVSGWTAPVAAWGGPLAVHVEADNIGASSIIQPLNLAQGAGSAADSGPTTVDVYVSTKAHNFTHAVKVATIGVPSIPQNSVLPIDQVISLPQQPHGFPGDGGKIFVQLRIDANKQSLDLDRTNNKFTIKQSVQIAAPLPDLEAIAMDVPPVIQPGDTVQVNAKIANLGTVDTAPQGPVMVDLVASTDTNFGPGDVVLAQVNIDDIQPLSEVPATNSVLGDVNISDPVNVRKISFPIVTLPGAPPNTYFLGIIVDPANTIREIREIGQPPSTELSPAVVVGPPITNLPPAGLVSAPASPANVFPIPPFGLIPIFSSSASTVTQSSTGGGISAAAANATLRLLPRARRFAALPPVNIHVPQGAVVTQPGTLRTVKVGHS
jgi:hypothetical protein